MDCYAEAVADTDFDVDTWTEQWLKKAGMNSLEVVKIEYLEDNKCRLTIEQKACMELHPTLRNHKINIAYFDDEKMYDVVATQIPA